MPEAEVGRKVEPAEFSLKQVNWFPIDQWPDTKEGGMISQTGYRSDETGATEVISLPTDKDSLTKRVSGVIGRFREDNKKFNIPVDAPYVFSVRKQGGDSLEVHWRRLPEAKDVTVLKTETIHFGGRPVPTTDSEVQESITAGWKNIKNIISWKRVPDRDAIEITYQVKAQNVPTTTINFYGFESSAKPVVTSAA